jgi:hypothetical protein
LVQPKLALPNIWLAKILFELLVAHELANIGKKDELEWAKSHFHAKNCNLPNKDHFLGQCRS